MKRNGLNIPPHYDSSKTGKVWRVEYEMLAQNALKWSKQNDIIPSSEDKFKVCLLAVDMQNTFCTPGFELFVAGRSGSGAVEDTKRMCEFIYLNLNIITEIIPTMDTHQPLQIFHSIFLVNEKGEHPAPYTLISVEDIEKGLWNVNKYVCKDLGIDLNKAQEYLLHYAKALKSSGKYNLTVWPYHAMLGGIGYALSSSFEEAVFFHSAARYSQPNFQIKGNNPFTEHYSVFGPEVKENIEGQKIARKNSELIERLMQFDAIIIAGQAKSHCVAWTIDDLLQDFLMKKKHLTEKVYLLEDCTSPVFIPGVIDYSDEANKAFEKFEDSGMHIVKSTTPIYEWPGMKINM